MITRIFLSRPRTGQPEPSDSSKSDKSSVFMCRLQNSAQGTGGPASVPLQKAPLLTWRSFLESPQQSMASEKPHMLHSLKTKLPPSPPGSFSFHSPWLWFEAEGSPADNTRCRAPGEELCKWGTQPLVCYYLRTTRKNF